MKQTLCGYQNFCSFDIILIVLLTIFSIVVSNEIDRSCVISDETQEKTCIDDVIRSSCKDLNDECSKWANDPNGGCYKNSRYMIFNCKESCGVCYSGYDPEKGVPQTVVGKESEMTLQVIDDMHRYMNEEVFVNLTYATIRNDCINNHDLCAVWAALGECEANSRFMLKECAPACKSCLYLDVQYRCPMPDPLNNAYEPGDLHAMFMKIANGDWNQYKPEILSAPSKFDLNDDNDNEDNNTCMRKPWVVVFDEFLSDTESDYLIQLGFDRGYERSADVGRKKLDGTYEPLINNGRTSYNAWCIEECSTDPVVINVSQRIANVTGIPVINSEYLQILRYDTGEYYNEHHDYVEFHLERPSGPRLLTFFLYLSDVEEGGGTKFSNVDLVVNPKKGRALLWPSVLDEDLSKRDESTFHEALPVTKGRKFAANAWLHLRDFRTPYEFECQ